MSVSRLDYEILKVLCYSSVFNVGLNVDEINKFLGIKADNGKVNESLKGLIKKGLVFGRHGIYALKPEYIENSIRNREVFKGYVKRFKWMFSLIYNLPFVRGIFITGSVGSGYPQEGDDIDILVVCKSRRLYTCRLFIMLFVKVFPKICPNYFITEDNIKFEPEDYYICRELAQMIPISSRMIYKKILCNNHWIFNVFPNFYPNEPVEVYEIKWLKKFLEILFSILPEKTLMDFQIKRFLKKGFKGKDIRINEKEFKPHKEPHRERIMESFLEIMYSLLYYDT